MRRPHGSQPCWRGCRREVLRDNNRLQRLQTGLHSQGHHPDRLFPRRRCRRRGHRRSVRCSQGMFCNSNEKHYNHSYNG